MNDYDGEIQECTMCDCEILIDSVFEEYKWIDGIGFLCSSCMGLENYSSDNIVSIDENDLEDFQMED